MNPIQDKVRLDKWLWSVRIYKTRSKASDACRNGEVKKEKKTLKPSYQLQEGEYLSVRKNGFNLTFLVKALITKRVSAILAQECYEDLTPEEELNKYQDWFIGKSRPESREKGSGRPTKKARREIDDFKEDRYGDN